LKAKILKNAEKNKLLTTNEIGKLANQSQIGKQNLNYMIKIFFQLIE